MGIEFIKMGVALVVVLVFGIFGLCVLPKSLESALDSSKWYRPILLLLFVCCLALWLVSGAALFAWCSANGLGANAQ